MVLLRGRSLFLFCAGWTKYNLDDMVKVCVDFLAWSSLSLRNHLDERVKDFGKVLVAVPVSSIDATVLVVKLDRTSNCLKGEIILWKMDLLAECDFLLISLASSTTIPIAYLCQSEATGCGFHTGEFVPQGLCHVLCHQGVRRLDLGEGFSHGGGGGGCTAVEIEGDGKEKAALKEEQLEDPAPGTLEAEGHFGLVSGPVKVCGRADICTGEAASFILPRVTSVLSV